MNNIEVPLVLHQDIRAVSFRVRNILIEQRLSRSDSGSLTIVTGTFQCVYDKLGTISQILDNIFNDAHHID